MAQGKFVACYPVAAISEIGNPDQRRRPEAAPPEGHGLGVERCTIELAEDSFELSMLMPVRGHSDGCKGQHRVAAGNGTVELNIRYNLDRLLDHFKPTEASPQRRE